MNTSTSTLNNDLILIQDWAEQWKISFKPGKIRQEQEVLFSKKTKLVTHSLLFFNYFEVKLAAAQKHLGLNLDSKLSINEHITDKMNTATRSIDLLHKLQSFLPCSSFLTIRKSFIRHHLDYNDVYDQTSNE